MYFAARKISRFNNKAERGGNGSDGEKRLINVHHNTVTSVLGTGCVRRQYAMKQYNRDHEGSHSDIALKLS